MNLEIIITIKMIFSVFIANNLTCFMKMQIEVWLDMHTKITLTRNWKRLIVSNIIIHLRWVFFTFFKKLGFHCKILYHILEKMIKYLFLFTYLYIFLNFDRACDIEVGKHFRSNIFQTKRIHSFWKDKF